jgi:hypothetical protein
VENFLNVLFKSTGCLKFFKHRVPFRKVKKIKINKKILAYREFFNLGKEMGGSVWRWVAKTGRWVVK